MNQSILKAYLLDVIDFEDVELYYACTKENKRRARMEAHKVKRNFSLEQFKDDEECLHLLRFNKSEIRRLVNCLELQGAFIARGGYAFTGTEGVCILLHRLSYPCRLIDLAKFYKRSRSAISEIFKWMINYIHRHFEYLLKTLDQDWLRRENIVEFAQAIRDRGSPLPYVWGFIDGTGRPICRPVRQQRKYYSGHRRHHCIKFQSVLCPNGLIALLHGPYIGRRHDSFILHLSKLFRLLERSNQLRLQGGRNFYLFGDTGYVNTNHIITGFRNPVAGSQEQNFNTIMSESRIVVEWGFGRIISLFAFLDFKKNNKLLLQPVGKWYIVAAILTNCHACVNSSQTGKYFGLRAPVLEDYLRKA